MAESYISVGKLGKPHGISGAFRFLLHRELKSKKKNPPYFILSSGKNAAPHFIKAMEWHGVKNEGTIAFEEISTPEEARQYSGSELQLMEKDVESFFKVEEQGPEYLIGYMALGETGENIGRIDEIMESPAQVLLHIENKDLLIPLVDEFIVKINKRKKEIILDLPIGLLDL